MDFGDATIFVELANNAEGYVLSAAEWQFANHHTEETRNKQTIRQLKRGLNAIDEARQTLLAALADAEGVR